MFTSRFRAARGRVAAWRRLGNAAFCSFTKQASTSNRSWSNKKRVIGSRRNSERPTRCFKLRAGRGTAQGAAHATVRIISSYSRSY